MGNPSADHLFTILHKPVLAAFSGGDVLSNSPDCVEIVYLCSIFNKTVIYPH